MGHVKSITQAIEGEAADISLPKPLSKSVVVKPPFPQPQPVPTLPRNLSPIIFERVTSPTAVEEMVIEERRPPGKLKKAWPPLPVEEDDPILCRIDPTLEMSRNKVSTLRSNFSEIDEIVPPGGSPMNKSGFKEWKTPQTLPPVQEMVNMEPEPQPQYGIIESNSIIEVASIQPEIIIVHEPGVSREKYSSYVEEMSPVPEEPADLPEDYSEEPAAENGYGNRVEVESEHDVQESSELQIKRSYETSEYKTVETKIYRQEADIEHLIADSGDAVKVALDDMVETPIMEDVAGEPEMDDIIETPAMEDITVVQIMDDITEARETDMVETRAMDDIIESQVMNDISETPQTAESLILADSVKTTIMDDIVEKIEVFDNFPQDEVVIGPPEQEIEEVEDSTVDEIKTSEELVHEKQQTDTLKNQIILLPQEIFSKDVEMFDQQAETPSSYIPQYIPDELIPTETCIERESLAIIQVETAISPDPGAESDISAYKTADEGFSTYSDEVKMQSSNLYSDIKRDIQTSELHTDFSAPLEETPPISSAEQPIVLPDLGTIIRKDEPRHSMIINENCENQQFNKFGASQEMSQISQKTIVDIQPSVLEIQPKEIVQPSHEEIKVADPLPQEEVINANNYRNSNSEYSNSYNMDAASYQKQTTFLSSTKVENKIFSSFATKEYDSETELSSFQAADIPFHSQLQRQSGYPSSTENIRSGFQVADIPFHSQMQRQSGYASSTENIRSADEGSKPPRAPDGEERDSRRVMRKKRESVKQLAIRLEDTIVPLSPDEVPGGIRTFPTPRQTPTPTKEASAPSFKRSSSKDDTSKNAENEVSSPIEPPSKEFPKLEPFPFTVQERQSVERPRSVPPPPKPKKFIPGSFTDSEYESENDSSFCQKFVPKKISFSVSKAPHNLRTASVGREPPSPTVFDVPPVFDGPMRPEILKEKSSSKQPVKEKVKSVTPRTNPKIVDKFLKSAGEGAEQVVVSPKQRNDPFIKRPPLASQNDSATVQLSEIQKTDQRSDLFVSKQSTEIETNITQQADPEPASNKDSRKLVKQWPPPVEISATSSTADDIQYLKNIGSDEQFSSNFSSESETKSESFRQSDEKFVQQSSFKSYSSSDSKTQETSFTSTRPSFQPARSSTMPPLETKPKMLPRLQTMAPITSKPPTAPPPVMSPPAQIMSPVQSMPRASASFASPLQVVSSELLISPPLQLMSPVQVMSPSPVSVISPPPQLMSPVQMMSPITASVISPPLQLMSPAPASVMSPPPQLMSPIQAISPDPASMMSPPPQLMSPAPASVMSPPPQLMSPAPLSVMSSPQQILSPAPYQIISSVPEAAQVPSPTITQLMSPIEMTSPTLVQQISYPAPSVITPVPLRAQTQAQSLSRLPSIVSEDSFNEFKTVTAQSMGIRESENAKESAYAAPPALRSNFEPKKTMFSKESTQTSIKSTSSKSETINQSSFASQKVEKKVKSSKPVSKWPTVESPKGISPWAHRSQSAERPPVTEAVDLPNMSFEAPEIIWSSNVTVKEKRASWPTAAPIMTAAFSEDNISSSYQESRKSDQSLNSKIIRKSAFNQPSPHTFVSSQKPKSSPVVSTPRKTSRSSAPPISKQIQPPTPEPVAIGSYKPIPDLEPFPFSVPEERYVQREKHPAPRVPSKFVPGSFTESEYESDYEGNFNPLWRPCASDSESFGYRQLNVKMRGGRSRSTQKNSPPPPSKFDVPPTSGAPLRPVVPRCGFDSDLHSSKETTPTPSNQGVSMRSMSVPKFRPRSIDSTLVNKAGIFSSSLNQRKGFEGSAPSIPTLVNTTTPDAYKPSPTQWPSHTTRRKQDNVVHVRNTIYSSLDNTKCTSTLSNSNRSSSIPNISSGNLGHSGTFSPPQDRTTSPMPSNFSSVPREIQVQNNTLPFTKSKTTIDSSSSYSSASSQSVFKVKPTSPKNKKKVDYTKPFENDDGGYAADTESTLPRRTMKTHSTDEASSFVKSESFAKSSFSSEKKSFMKSTSQPPNQSPFGRGFQSPPILNANMGMPGSSAGAGIPPGPQIPPKFPSAAPFQGHNTQQSSSFFSSESKSSQVCKEPRLYWLCY